MLFGVELYKPGSWNNNPVNDCSVINSFIALAVALPLPYLSATKAPTPATMAHEILVPLPVAFKSSPVTPV